MIKIFPDNLAEILLRKTYLKGINLVRLSEMLGVSKSTITLAFEGKASQEVFKGIFDILGIEEKDLFPPQGQFLSEEEAESFLLWANSKGLNPQTMLKLALYFLKLLDPKTRESALEVMQSGGKPMEDYALILLRAGVSPEEYYREIRKLLHPKVTQNQEGKADLRIKEKVLE
jgi:transcriptional regulator with XRE-family HTH domain